MSAEKGESTSKRPAEMACSIWPRHAVSIFKSSPHGLTHIMGRLRSNAAQSTLRSNGLKKPEIITSPALSGKLPCDEASPREASYVMVLAIQQQLGQREAAADTLELLVKAHPGKALYWQQLAGTYLSLAADSADSAEAAASATTCRPQLRALLTLERAQALGHLTSAVDQANANALRALLSQPTSVTAHAL